MSVTTTKVQCKYCNSEDVIRYGSFKNIQRWWCKACQRKFAGNDALPGMKVADCQIGLAVGAYYDGLPIIGITREIFKKFGIFVSGSSVYKWVNKYSRMAIDETRYDHPEVGDTWVAHKTQIKIGGVGYWCVDLIDFGTRFLIATVVFDNFNDLAINQLIESAVDRVRKLPKNLIILGDGWLSKLISLKYRSYNKNIYVTILEGEKYSEFIELFRCYFKMRNRVLSKLKKKEHLKIIVDGCIVHYNYRRVHESLGRTPAEEAGI